MRTILSGVAAAAMFLSGGAAFAQYQQYPQSGAYGQYDGSYGRVEGGYGQNGAYGRYDRSDNRSRARRTDLFESVRMDLEQAASQYSYRGDDNHLNSALDHLARFRDGMLRGEYRRGDLNKTIEQTQNLARSGGIAPEMRPVLYRDLDAMRDYRSHMDRQRDSYYYGRRPSYYPY